MIVISVLDYSSVAHSREILDLNLINNYRETKSYFLTSKLKFKKKENLLMNSMT